MLRPPPPPCPPPTPYNPHPIRPWRAALFPTLLEGTLDDEWVDLDPPQFKSPVRPGTALLPHMPLRLAPPPPPPVSQAEIAVQMDIFDWTGGLAMRQNRVAYQDDDMCGSTHNM